MRAASGDDTRAFQCCASRPGSSRRLAHTIGSIPDLTLFPQSKDGGLEPGTRPAGTRSTQASESSAELLARTSAANSPLDHSTVFKLKTDPARLALSEMRLDWRVHRPTLAPVERVQMRRNPETFYNFNRPFNRAGVS